MAVTITKPATIKNVELNKSKFRLKIMKGYNLADEMKNALEAEVNDGKVNFNNVFL